jgi:hypothetical protein
MPVLTHPLTKNEIEHLDDFLYGLNHGKVMTLEVDLRGYKAIAYSYQNPDCSNWPTT